MAPPILGLDASFFFDQKTEFIGDMLVLADEWFSLNANNMIAVFRLRGCKWNEKAFICKRIENPFFKNVLFNVFIVLIVGFYFNFFKKITVVWSDGVHKFLKNAF